MSIGKNAFAYCGKVKELIIPSSAATLTIGDEAFCGCGDLEEFIIEEGAETLIIGSDAFGGCKKLNEIIFPDTVKELVFKAGESLISTIIDTLQRFSLFVRGHRLENVVIGTLTFKNLTICELIELLKKNPTALD